VHGGVYCLATARVEGDCRDKSLTAQRLNEVVDITVNDDRVLDGKGLGM
jgi:hypothetical protein